MSCLRHVSKRRKEGFADDLGVAKDSIQQVSSGGLSTTDVSEKVWSLHDLSILHELQKPIAVVSTGGYDTRHRSADCLHPACFAPFLLISSTKKLLLCRSRKEQACPSIIFHNADCQRRFGLPRSHAACCELVSALPEEDRHALQEWEMEVIQVTKT